MATAIKGGCVGFHEFVTPPNPQRDKRARGVRFGRIVLVVLAATGLLVGCSSSRKPSSHTATLSYWAVSMAPTLAQDRAILSRELAKFTDRSGIDVDVEIMNWSTAYTKIMNAVTSGHRPDVIDIGNTWSATLQATGAFLPLTTRRSPPSEVGAASSPPR